jgi:Neprosin
MGKLMAGVARILPLCALVLVLSSMMRPDIAFAQQSTVAINLMQGPAGTRVTGTGTNWQLGDRMQVTWDGATILANTNVRSDGTFTASFNVPSNATAGAHNIYFTDLDSRYFLVAIFTLTPGQAAPLPGWYRNSGADGPGSTIFEDDRLKIMWENSYIYQHPGTDNLYWYAEVKYINKTKQPLGLTCIGFDNSLVREHIRGTEGIPPDGDGYVMAEETFCTRNPNLNHSIDPEGTHHSWAIFHNVPPGGQVRLEWGQWGSSAAWVNPWQIPFDSPPPGECPQELVNFGTCVPGPLCPPIVPQGPTDIFWYVAGSQCSTAVGVYAAMSEHRPYVDAENAKAGGHSIAEIAVLKDSGNGRDAIEAGWVVWPSLYPDGLPHLFVSRTVGAQVTQCSPNFGHCYAWDTNSGWVPAQNAKHHVGDTVTPTSDPQEYKIQYSQGQWQVFYQNDLLGYFPATGPTSPWPNNRFTQITQGRWYGEVSSPRASCTAMGNSGYGSRPASAVITGMGFINANGSQTQANAFRYETIHYRTLRRYGDRSFNLLNI